MSTGSSRSGPGPGTGTTPRTRSSPSGTGGPGSWEAGQVVGRFMHSSRLMGSQRAGTQGQSQDQGQHGGTQGQRQHRGDTGTETAPGGHRDRVALPPATLTDRKWRYSWADRGTPHPELDTHTHTGRQTGVRGMTGEDVRDGLTRETSHSALGCMLLVAAVLTVVFSVTAKR
ncbi:hypothetical protein INR49_001166 [Caranx melampygus]|nr:hypothetical protein INR49_001166 [Caranx melampygus]